MIRVVAEAGSTNGELLARLAAGERIDEGQWLVADRQSAGRGRAGRAWFDGAGNFMGSTVARLRASDPPPQTLALVAGLAAFEAMAAAMQRGSNNSVRPEPVEGLPFFSPAAEAKDGASTSSARTGLVDCLMLKWPNDLLLDRAKLGGILLERQGEAVVVGIGVNLASAPALPQRRTTCLAAHGCAVARDAFAARLAAIWAELVARWHAGQWPSLRAEWLARAHPPGTSLAVTDAAGKAIVGAFAGLGEDGAAHLRLADGRSHVIHAGEVEMVGHAARG